MAGSISNNSHHPRHRRQALEPCHVLKDDGVTYHQCVSELTDLLFLKMAKETGTEAGIPEEWRWDELEKLRGLKQLEHYKLLLLELGSSESDQSTPLTWLVFTPPPPADHHSATNQIRSPSWLMESAKPRPMKGSVALLQLFSSSSQKPWISRANSRTRLTS
jgi:hypothetical protein